MRIDGICLYVCVWIHTCIHTHAGACVRAHTHTICGVYGTSSLLCKSTMHMILRQGKDWFKQGTCNDTEVRGHSKGRYVTISNGFVIMALKFACIFLHAFLPVPKALGLPLVLFPLGSAMVNK